VSAGATGGGGKASGLGRDGQIRGGGGEIGGADVVQSVVRADGYLPTLP
jgi:hypothetical protein